MSKIVVITGISRGLGLALANEFATQDWQVIGTGRSKQPRELPPGVIYHQFDAADANACRDFWQQTKVRHADAQPCLINNAGNYKNGSLIENTPENYDQQMRSCYFTAVYMTQGLALNFSNGRIMNIISTGALAAHKNDSAYGAAKAAEKHFFQALQQEFKPEQYRITNLYPSDIATQNARPGAISPPDLARFVREQAENNSTYYVRDVTIYPSITL